MASASETELVSLFYGCKAAIPLRVTLKEMGHPYPGPTPVTTDNSTAVGSPQKTMIPKASKLIDVHFHWLQNWHAQQLFTFLWVKGFNNWADYPSKHPPPKYHTGICRRYVNEPTVK